MKFKDVVFAITAISTGAACALGVVILTRADAEVDQQWVAPAGDAARVTGTPKLEGLSRAPAASPSRTVRSRVALSPRPRKPVRKSPESPESAGESLAPSLSPKPRASAKPSPSVTGSREPSKSPKPLPSKSVVEVRYDNCDEVREAGAAPIYRGDPGYGRHLDRDGDGVGCEDD